MDRIVSPLLTFGDEKFQWQVESLVTDFKGALEDVVGTLRRALLFMLMRVSHHMCREGYTGPSHV